jgi:peptide/nickel transport system substrate-binding protein
MLKLKAGEVRGGEFVACPPASRKSREADTELSAWSFWPSTRVAYAIVFSKETLTNGAKNPLAKDEGPPGAQLRRRRGRPSSPSPPQGLRREARKAPCPLGHADGHVLGRPRLQLRPRQGEGPDGRIGVGEVEIACMMVAGNQDSLNNLTALQQMWAPIGVKLKIEQLDNPTNVARYRAEDFQMRHGGWTDDIADPSEITSYFAYSPTVNNLHSGWKSAKVDELFMQSQAEIDVAKRKAIYKELQQIYIDEAPIVFLYETPTRCAGEERQGLRADPARQQLLRGCLRREGLKSF